MPETTNHSAIAESDGDLATLQGAWRQVDFEENGIHNPPDEHAAEDAITTIVGRHFQVRGGDDRLILEGDFTLDASTSPKSITWIDAIGADKGKPLPAIYTLDAKRFAFIAADTHLPRPTTFRTGPGQTMRSFVRIPAKIDSADA